MFSRTNIPSVLSVAWNGRENAFHFNFQNFADFLSLIRFVVFVSCAKIYGMLVSSFLYGPRVFFIRTLAQHIYDVIKWQQ